MVTDTQQYHEVGRGVGSASLKTVRPRLFRRASLTSWGKNNLAMTRAAAVNLKELMLTVQQQKYEDRDKAAQREMSRNESNEGEQSMRNRDDRRSRLLLRSTAKREFLENWQREGRANWNANQAALCRYERRLLNYELAVKATAAARKRMSRDRHSNDEVDGIQWFEHNLDRLGLDPGGGSTGGSGGPGAGGGTLSPDRETPETFRSRLVRAVLDQKFVPSSNAETMAELRFRGMTGRRGRQEREHRRVKTEVDQRRAKAETDAQRSSETHLNKMLHEGRERREAAATCWGKRHDLEQKAISDKRRFAKIAAAHGDAFETAFNARASHTRESHEASKAEREAKTDTLRARLLRNRNEKRCRAVAMCVEIAQKVSDLAVVASEARASRGGVPLPPTMWAHLKRWFFSPEPFFVNAVPPEPPPELRDPVLDAKTLLESKNLNRCEGFWRLRGNKLPAGVSSAPSPLSKALAVARDLVIASGGKPREAPTYGRSGRPSEGNPTDPDVRLVLLSPRDELGDVSAKLGRWVHLYVCSLETALECAMEVGAETASGDLKGSKGRKGSISGRKNSLGVEALEKNAVDADAALGGGNAKDAMFRKCFHPDATEEDVAAFKAAAAAYHAVRTHPKKASTPVPPATTTDLLVKHLLCRAPRGRGWILVGYPSTLLEAKLLENALSGYTDEEVAAELGTGGKASKPDVKTKKGSTIPLQQKEKSHVSPRSGLDAVLKLTEPCLNSTHLAGLTPDSSAGTDGGGAEDAFDNELAASAADEINRDQGEDNVEEGDSLQEREAQTAWWRGFEGGHLSCDVPNETNDERLLETLFLLVNAAQNRKDEREIWLKEAACARKSLEDGAVQTLEGCSSAEPDGDTKLHSTTAVVVDRPSPLASPLTASLEGLRCERWRMMCQSTRIQLEASMGDRKLDIEGLRSVVSQADATAEISGYDAPVGACSLQWTAALQKLEAECPAFCVLDWAAAAEFSFSRELRTPDDRWTTTCLQLEAQMEGWLARGGDAVEVAQSMRRRSGRATMGDSGDRSVTASAPPAEEDIVWEALEAFQLEAGDVVDDRHSSAEVTMREIDEEADRKVRAWTGKIESAAAGLCAAERAAYLGTVKTLRVLGRLFGLEEDQSNSASAESTREAVRAAANALAKELSAMPLRKGSTGGEGYLEKEVRLATEQVCQQNERAAFASGPRQQLATLPDMECETQQESQLSPGRGGVKEGSSSVRQGNDWAGANSQTTDAEAESSVTIREYEGDKESGALAAAVWRCRQTYVCRLRRVMMRLLRAVERCEARVASMRVALRRLKGRRVQLEHEGITAATATVRRILQECDHVLIADILNNGIPLWVEDDETYAADPFVAFPWGMNGLGLPLISSLAGFLQRSLSGAEDDTGGKLVVAVSGLSHAVRAWLHSATIGNNGEGTRANIPRPWISSGSGYVDTLCRAIAGGMNVDNVSWRRLVHCLLLGHVRSLPTLEDLRSMRYAFSLKASTASQASTGGALKGSPATEGIGPLANTAPPGASGTAQIPTLRIAQRHFTGIPLWFEQQGNEARGGKEQAGSDGRSSAIRNVYSKAWGGGDGRVDGMDLLLTLCAVPDDIGRENPCVGVDEEGIADTGIPFSAGLFRAFFMLAEAPSSAASDDKVVPWDNRDLAPRPSSAGIPGEVAAATTGILSSTKRRDGVVPRVSLPHLRAILGCGGGMTPGDVSVVCELVAKKEEVSRSRSQVQTQGCQRHATTVAVRSPEEATSADNGPVVAGGARTEAMEATGATEGDRDVAIDKTATESAGGRQGIAAAQLQEPPLTVSFAVVSECEAVRDWVRRGAYTLPAFDAISGRQRDVR